jgi:hypothetical protein
MPRDVLCGEGSINWPSALCVLVLCNYHVVAEPGRGGHHQQISERDEIKVVVVEVSRDSCLESGCIHEIL